MKTTEKEHPGSALLDYLDGSLSPTDGASVEDHIATCPECSQELEDLKMITETLTAAKEEIFCPEPWQLHGFSENGEDPEGLLARHLDQCADCRKEISLCGAGESEPMTDKARRAFEDAAVRPKPAGSPGSDLFSRVRDFLRSCFRPPIMALGTAAAAVLALFLIYPAAPLKTTIGLSDIHWSVPGQDLRGKTKSLVDEEKPRTVIVPAFKGLRQPFSQETTDALYRGLQPTKEMYDRFNLISPAVVSKALSNFRERPLDRKAAVEALTRELNVSYALFMTVTPDNGEFDVTGELIDAKTGRVLRKRISKHVGELDLGSTMRASAGIILSEETQRRPR